MAFIALLYYATPNVKQPKLQWLSPGAAFSLVAMAIAGAAFGFYVSNFGSYNATYGTIGGVIVMLLFIWIMNNVLLFGAVLDSELERARELEAGIRAEEHLRLPPRDTRQAHKLVESRQKFVDEGRRLRLQNDRLDYSASPANTPRARVRCLWSSSTVSRPRSRSVGWPPAGSGVSGPREPSYSSTFPGTTTPRLQLAFAPTTDRDRSPKASSVSKNPRTTP